MSRLLSVITIFVLTTLIAQPSYSDDVTINLNNTTPYVDVPVTITEPVDAVISTTTGTPQTNPGFIDSWIEVWQGLNKLRADDDGAHSASNVLASIIRMPLTAGEYFIRATSFAYMCCNAYPTGTYVLSTNLTVSMPSPSPTATEVTPEPSPSPTETQTSSPTPVPSLSPTSDVPSPEPSFPSPLPSDTQQPSASPEVPVVPNQEPSEPSPEVLLESLTPEPSQLPDVQDTLEEVVDLSPSVSPSSLPSLEEVYEEIPSPSSIDEILDLLSFLPELSLENLQETFQEISETITVALDTVSNLGSEFTPEEREQAQQVVLGAVIVTQLSTSTRRIK